MPEKPKKPIRTIVVTKPDDPRLQMYADSLTAYQATKDMPKMLQQAKSSREWSDMGKRFMEQNKPAVMAIERLQKAGATPSQRFDRKFKDGTGYAMTFQAPTEEVVFVKQEAPKYTSPKRMYQGYGFTQRTGLRAGNYHPEEVAAAMEAMKKKRNGTR